MAVRYTDNNTKSLKFLSSQGNAPTADQMVSKLFDLSLQGYFVHEVYMTTDYAITLNLGFSKSMKSNIDADVLKRVAEILDGPIDITPRI